MSNTTQIEKANQRREQFAKLLREMFQLNQPELDFGLYRIMHARKDDINRFIEEDLPSITQEAFKQFASLDKTQIEQALVAAKKAAEGAGISPEDSPKVRELEAQLKDNFDLAREEGEVYDALVTFFNRYYSEGDFLSRRVYKDGTYAIPYQGEEVVLHWANKDQYYIKSSENLRDYAFRLNPDAGEGEDPLRVHFKLVDADAGAKDNNKESESSKRVFILDAENPFELIDGEPNGEGEPLKELQLRFFFRAATMEDWTEAAQGKATAAAQKKPPTRDALISIAIERLLGSAAILPEPWKTALSRPYKKADGDTADYSILQGQLNNYTKKNTFDYFIHKDLGGFLTRELDFYIKNELMDWADIAALKNDPARLAPLLSKIEVIRTLGEKIITFLAQLENFQKKLWLKKKFVTETQYCITLDRIEEHSDLLSAVFSNDKQKADWADLYKLDLTELEADLKSAGVDYSQLLAEPKYRYLMLDTSHFDEQFKADLLATIEDLDEQCDGLLVHSENFQALNLLKERYREQVKCIYIDPPYNTGGDGFAYKDQYRHSSWISMIRDRLSISRSLLSDDGVIFVSSDEIERVNLDLCAADVYGHENKIEDVIWVKNTTHNDSPTYSTNHEYVQVYAKSALNVEKSKEMFRESKPGYAEVMELISQIEGEYPTVEEIEAELRKLFKRRKSEFKKWIKEQGLEYDNETKKLDQWKGIYNYNRAEYRDKNGRLVDQKDASQLLAKIWVWREDNPSMPSGKQSNTTKDSSHPNYRFYNPIHPVTQKKCPCPKRGWAWPESPVDGRKSFEELASDHRIAFGVDESKVPQEKKFLQDAESNVAKSVVHDYTDGEKELTRIEGAVGSFPNLKPSTLVRRLVDQTAFSGDLVVDYFAGSGTTGQAVIDAVRSNGRKRKYVLVEMASYFDSILLPRVKKAIYAETWEYGLPQSQLGGMLAGISQGLKVVRLESYEDALGNLELRRIGRQISLGVNAKATFYAYLMNYMLDVETRDSQSLLNTDQFLDPTQYQLNVRSASSDETKTINVDLLETFNYLLGLRVEHIAAPLHFEAELKQGEHGRWAATVKRNESGRWWFRTVYGTNPNGEKVVVVWRNLPSVIDGEEKGLEHDNAVLDAVLLEKLKIRLTESQDDEVDILYVNGDHNITIPRDRKGQPLEHARVQVIEEAFHSLMFADTETVH